jgi:predicted site-specific integrase-resolvase
MNDWSKKTVALYARVSTLDQSCAMQLEDLRRYVARFGRSYEYVEIGVSGAQRRRPQQASTPLRRAANFCFTSWAPWHSLSAT